MSAAAVGRAAAGRSALKSHGDRPWSEAADATLAEGSDRVRKRAKDIHGAVDADAVHDMRTATRRLRTAIKIYGEEAAKADRQGVEKEVRRVARRLGAVRDLDILLEALAGAGSDADGHLDPDDLEPLRRAWEDERRAAADRLKDEIGRDRFRAALDDAKQLLHTSASDTDDAPGRGSALVERIAHRAPALIWEAAGKVLAYELDALTADPSAIHEMRIAAKKLRYTLEAFEEAIEPGSALIEEVTTLQDAGGEMHDAIVARDRARTTLDSVNLRRSERIAIEAFARLQDRRAEARRPDVARSLAAIRSRRFRDALGRAVAGMGHITGDG
jgi:CHAD domain-containing protein